MKRIGTSAALLFTLAMAACNALLGIEEAKELDEDSGSGGAADRRVLVALAANQIRLVGGSAGSAGSAGQGGSAARRAVSTSRTIRTAVGAVTMRSRALPEWFLQAGGAQRRRLGLGHGATPEAFFVTGGINDTFNKLNKQTKQLETWDAADDVYWSRATVAVYLAKILSHDSGASVTGPLAPEDLTAGGNVQGIAVTHRGCITRSTVSERAERI
jgi:hypothetical protein